MDREVFSYSEDLQMSGIPPNHKKTKEMKAKKGHVLFYAPDVWLPYTRRGTAYRRTASPAVCT